MDFRICDQNCADNTMMFCLLLSGVLTASRASLFLSVCPSEEAEVGRRLRGDTLGTADLE